MMKKNYKLILPATVGFLVVLAIALTVIRQDEDKPVSKQLSSSPRQQNMVWNQERPRETQAAEGGLPEQSSPGLDPVLQKALEEKNPSSRKELLRRWALSVPLNDIRSRIGGIGAVSDKQMRSEAYYELFARWAAEDPVNAVSLMRKMSAVGAL
jgi:hypothetical protein